MKVGLQINRFDYPKGNTIGKTVADIAVAAEENGFETIWVMDHFLELPRIGNLDDPMLEAYTTLGYIAGVTSKVKLGTMVTGVIYREPAILIKAVTSLDVLSEGRAYFGIGAGWFDTEAKALGLLDPLSSGRFTRLEETLQLAKQMWANDRKPFNGKYYQLPEPISSPSPVSKPHPPILIGGSGEQKTLKLVARYAKACNLFASDLEQLKHKLDVLKSHCEDEQRPFEDIEKTVLVGTNVTLALENRDSTMKTINQLSELGIDHAIFAASAGPDLKSYQDFKDVVQEINSL